jgi:hypothetical protein
MVLEHRVSGYDFVRAMLLAGFRDTWPDQTEIAPIARVKA